MVGTKDRKRQIGKARPVGEPTPGKVLSRHLKAESMSKWQAEFRKQVGRRLKAARETLGIEQLSVAVKLGYTAATHVNEWENGKRLPGPEKIAILIDIYGTTADYIYGLSDTPDRDPASGLQRLVAAHLTSQMQRLMTQISTLNAQALRELGHDQGDVLATCRTVLEAHGALDAARRLNPKFDQVIKGGSQLVSKLDIAANRAQDTVNRIERVQRATKLRSFAHGNDFLASGGSMQLELMLAPEGASNIKGPRCHDLEGSTS